MHILISILHRPTKPTGVCRHGVNLARCLSTDDKIEKITLVIGNWQKKYFTEVFDLSSPKIELISINLKNSSIARNYWFFFGLPKLVRKLNPDLVHLTFPLPFLPDRFTVPVISTIHDLYPYECPENFGYPNVLFNRWFLKQAIMCSDGLTCVSQSTLTKLKQYFPSLQKDRKLSVVYNYVNFSENDNQQNQPLTKVKDFPFILCVAQHRKNKNLSLLIEAYSLLLENRTIPPETKLTIVGSSGPETKNIERKISSLKLKNKVLLVSAINDSKLCWLYKKCQLFIIPSSTEGFCLPLAEALYFNCKIVCSDIAIFREIGTDNCTYFSLENNPIDNCVGAIKKSLELPNYSLEAGSFVFSLENARKQYISHYNACFEKKPSS